jgi:hypothetical protein
LIILYSLNNLKIKQHMKKFLAVLAIAGTLVACDNSGSGSGSADSANKAGGDTTTINNNTTVTPPTGGDTSTTAPLTGDTSTKTGTDTSRSGQ